MDPRRFPFFGPIPFIKQPSARRMFSTEEDTRLKSLVSQFGENDWKTISKEMGDRSCRQCRERYKNYLSPKLSNTPWSQSEDDLLRQKYLELGPKWSQMTGAFVGRSDVSLKNRWAAINSRPDMARTPVEKSVEDVKRSGAFNVPSQKVPGNDPNEFSIAQLLWTTSDRTSALKAELNLESERPVSSFPNYGGRLW
jgi:hypothetical protein